MPRKKEPEFFIATTSGVLKVKGRNEMFVRGKTIVHRESPLYRAAPHYFKAIDRPSVEQATAAPGERR